jgi:hypothetical protein
MTTALQAAFIRNPFSDVVHSVERERISHSAKQSSGMKFQNLGELRKAGVMSDYVSLVKKMDEIDAIEVSNSKVESRINLQTGLIQGIQETLQTLRSQVMEYSVATASIDIKMLAKSNLRQVALTLNTTAADGFEFGGATADIPPIEDIEAFVETSNLLQGKPTRNYTKLVSSDSRVRVDLQREIDVEFDASHPAFQKFIAALHMMKDLTPESSKDATVKMFDEANKAFDALIVDISFNDKILTDAKSSLAVTKATAVEEMETKFKASIPDLVSEAESIRMRLTSAISTLAQDTKRPRLLDFVR